MTFATTPRSYWLRGSWLLIEKETLSGCRIEPTGAEEGAALVYVDHNRAPLFEAVQQYRDSVKAALHVPGHKLGHGSPKGLQDLMGRAVLGIDLTEAPGLDDLHAPSGVIAEAQQLAAAAFGARRSFFLVGGTTAGLHALIMAACRPGSRVLVPRYAHRSVLGALILSGAIPIWVKARFNDLFIAQHLCFDSLEEGLPKADAAVLVHPTYQGYTGRLKDEIELIHRWNIPVIVDEAHGTHFAFHPDLPPSALSLGADGTVQSVHKTGGSLTQSSICHLGKRGRLAEERVGEMLRLVQSTSPSYLLMASLDIARQDLALHGRQRWTEALDLSYQARRRLAALPGIMVGESDDPTKVVIDVRGRSTTGFAAADHLWSRGVAVEFSGLGYLLAVLSPGDTSETIDHLIDAVESIPSGGGIPRSPEAPPWPEVVLAPRAAFLGPKESVPLQQAVGRIAAEMAAPYPPGIPVVAPGERLTRDVLDYLGYSAAAGYHMQGPLDPGLRSIQVVKE